MKQTVFWPNFPQLSTGLLEGEPGSGNLLVQEDNLHAFKALLPHYAGQVKCIYAEDLSRHSECLAK